MEQPFLAEHPVIAVAATDTEKSDVDIEIGRIGRPNFEFFGGLNAAALITDTCEP